METFATLEIAQLFKAVLLPSARGAWGRVAVGAPDAAGDHHL